MPTTLADLLTEMASTSLGFMTDVVTDWWPYILGIVVLVAIGRRFKRLVGLAR